MNSFKRTLSLAHRCVANYLQRRPFCVSYEITYHCNARCRHCHLGGTVQETRVPANRFAEITRELKPVVVQISGGEPLLHPELTAIIRVTRRVNRSPYIVITTNGSLLNRHKYQELLKEGVDEFSLSYDFPDERHDEFRGIKGLQGRIHALLNSFHPNEQPAITLACVIQNDNLSDLITMAEQARKWRIRISFSAYTWLRTKKKDLMITPGRLPELRRTIDRLLAFKKKYRNIYTSDYILNRLAGYFERGSVPNCRAGESMLVVNPDGTFSPCGLIITSYRSFREIRKDFIKKNRCSFCYTASRANSERPTRYLIKDALVALPRRV